MAWTVIRQAATLLILGLAASTCLAAVAIGPARTHPDHPDECWLPKSNRTHPEGAQWQEPNCVRATCITYMNKLYVQYASCGAVSVDPWCRTVQDLTLPYPSCCPVPSCPDPPSRRAPSPDYYEDFNNWIGEYYSYYDQPRPTS